MPRRVSPTLAALLFGTLLTAAARGADEPRITTKQDVVYTRVGEADLKLDLAYPAEVDGPFPAVLVIHGGGWRAGSKDGNRPLLAEFAKRGYVAVSPQYRFCPKDTFPAQVHDVKAAVRWLRSHAGDYKVDPDHIGAMGFSAGGHLSLMLGLTGPDDGLEGTTSGDAASSRVQAVVNYFGPTDLTAADIPENSKPLLKDFLGGPPTDAKVRPRAVQASPITYVTGDDPPVLTFQGTKDPLVPHSQALKLADACSYAGVPGRVELMVGRGHGWQGDDLKQTMRETFAFFDQHLKPSSSK